MVLHSRYKPMAYDPIQYVDDLRDFELGPLEIALQIIKYFVNNILVTKHMKYLSVITMSSSVLIDYFDKNRDRYFNNINVLLLYIRTQNPRIFETLILLKQFYFLLDVCIHFNTTAQYNVNIHSFNTFIIIYIVMRNALIRYHFKCLFFTQIN